MPLIALFGALLNLVRSSIAGGTGGSPALRPIPISERERLRRRR